MRKYSAVSFTVISSGDSSAIILQGIGDWGGFNFQKSFKSSTDAVEFLEGSGISRFASCSHLNEKYMIALELQALITNESRFLGSVRL
jgi:hypothetical protein